MNNNLLKLNSKVACIKQIQLNLYREQEGVFEQIKNVDIKVKEDLAES